MEYNLLADLAAHLDVYRKFAESHTAVQYPLKTEGPLVWDNYLQTGGAAALELPSAVQEQPLPLQAAPTDALPLPLTDFTAQAATPSVLADFTTPLAAPPTLSAFPAQTQAPQPLAALEQSGGAGTRLTEYARPETAFTLSGEGATEVTYQPAISGDSNLLGQMNDQLKTQARRYPHPIAYRMEAIE